MDINYQQLHISISAEVPAFLNIFNKECNVRNSSSPGQCEFMFWHDLSVTDLELSGLYSLLE